MAIEQLACPKTCICDVITKSAVCNSTSDLDLLSRAVRSLKVTGVHNDLLIPPELEGLQELDLDNCRIETLTLKSRKLTSLKLRGNKLRKSDLITLAKSVQHTLEYWDLSDNNITDEAMENIPEMQVLRHMNIRFNRGLNTIWNFNLKKFPELQSLKIRQCGITLLPSPKHHHSNDLNNLTYLDVSFNNITRLTSYFSQHFKNLEVLDLSFNRIKNIDNLPTLVRTLNLSGNPITHLTKESFKNLKKLEKIDLSNIKKLTSIDPNTFTDTEQLREINLRACRNLAHLNSRTFISLKQLRAVDLRACALRELGRHLFASSTNLQELKVSDNALQCNCELVWLSRYAEYNATCVEPRGLQHRKLREMDLNCTGARIANYSAGSLWTLVGGAAMLDCLAVGDPQPTVRWKTSNGRYKALFPLLKSLFFVYFFFA